MSLKMRLSQMVDELNVIASGLDHISARCVACLDMQEKLPIPMPNAHEFRYILDKAREATAALRKIQVP